MRLPGVFSFQENVVLGSQLLQKLPHGASFTSFDLIQTPVDAFESF
jgi:hypothetical protein